MLLWEYKPFGWLDALPCVRVPRQAGSTGGWPVIMVTGYGGGGLGGGGDGGGGLGDGGGGNGGGNDGGDGGEEGGK